MTTNNNSLYSNNGRTLLTSSISSGDSAIPVTSTSSFPTISSSGDYFYITLDDGVNLEIVKVGGTTSNSFTSCVRGQQGTSAHAYSSTTRAERRLTAVEISAMARKTDRLADIASVDNLIAPPLSDGNSALCGTLDEAGVPIVAVSSGTKWRFLNYPLVASSGNVGSGSTTTSMSLTGASTLLQNTADRAYIIQFTSGVNIGLARIITVLTNSVAWSTALPSGPNPSDLYEIYEGMFYSISIERIVRAEADSALNTAISDEASARGAAISGLSSAISSEASTRGGADTALSTAISAEASARGAAISGLSSAISSEASTRGGADTALSTAISAEALARGAADALLAPLASPTLTGVPTAPTAAAGTSTTQIASTAFVTSAVGAAVPSASPVTGTSTSGTWTGPGGLTVQWGQVIPSDGSGGGGDIGAGQHTFSVSFPMAFTLLPLAPDISYEENSTDPLLPDIFLAHKNLSTTGFTLLAWESSGRTQNAVFHWKAWGYITP